MLKENKNIDHSYTDRVVRQLVDETEIDFNAGKVHLPTNDYQYISFDHFGPGGLENALRMTPSNSFGNHIINNYGIDEEEFEEVLTKYMEVIGEKINRYLAPIFNLQENKNIDWDYTDRVLQRMVDETIIEDGSYWNPIAYPPWIISDNEGVDLGILIDSGLDHWHFKEFSVYVHDMYGLSETEMENIWEPYLDGLDEKYNLYITQNNLNHPWRINESKEDLNDKVHKAVEAAFKKNKKLKGEDKIKKYFEDKGLNKQDADEAMVQYLSKQQSLNESVDLSYSDDKDFPFLNKLANHTMSITEIERNAVMFPFIEGYISDGNFYKYFHGTPYDQLPFEATIKMDGYLKDFGLTENEKEIWWDIYVIKVIDAINERDLKIINNYGELNESTEDIYEKIANSIANESEIVISPAPYNKMFLKGPAWEQAQHIENVIDQLRGMERNSLPDLFVKHLKEIFNIEKKGYNTVVQTIWRLYRNKMIKKIEDAKERLNVPNKQQKFFDHIIKTLVDETEVQTMKDWMPDDDTYEQKVWVTPPFLNHRIDLPGERDESVGWNEFSYFGYGYARYMRDIYGLTDKEGLKIWGLYYKALQKKVEELIERDRIIYGDD